MEKFKDTLDSVELFCLQYSKKNESMVVLGDFNAHLSDSQGCPKKTQKLLKMIYC